MKSVFESVWFSDMLNMRVNQTVSQIMEDRSLKRKIANYWKNTKEWVNTQCVD